MKRSTDRRWSLAEIRQNQKEHYAGMAEHPPDRKASADFRRPAYPNYTVEDALKKWGVDTRKGWMPVERNIDGYVRLAHAIVEKAGKDYRAVLKKLKRNPEDSQAQWEKMNIERFFRRDAGAYMDVDGDYIIDRIQREVDKNERLTKAIQKAKERAADS